MNYQPGDKIIFTDEFGAERIGTVVSVYVPDTPGQLGIDAGSYGVYSREPEEVRPAPSTDH